MSGRVRALFVFCALCTVSSTASANSATGVKSLMVAAALVIGIAAMALAAALGAMAWATALRPPTAVGWIFGRGFLALSAIFSFAVGGVFLAMGLEVWVNRTPDWVGVFVFVLVASFLAIEFFVAGVLYRRSNAHRPSLTAKLLSFASFAIGALWSLGTLGLLMVLAVTLLPDDQKGPTSQVRGYQRGCEEQVASDCNMLGLRYRTGDRGLPKDPVKAQRSFEKACELGASIGCRNAAEMHRKGEGVPRDPEAAKRFSAREVELAKPR